MYQGVRNISISKNFAYVLNEWVLMKILFRSFLHFRGIERFTTAHSCKNMVNEDKTVVRAKFCIKWFRKSELLNVKG